MEVKKLFLRLLELLFRVIIVVIYRSMLLAM